jgi:hypothetical protein
MRQDFPTTPGQKKSDVNEIIHIQGLAFARQFISRATVSTSVRMPYTSPLEIAAVTAASKVRSKISKTHHDKFAWLHPPESKDFCTSVVEQWLKVRTK